MDGNINWEINEYMSLRQEILQSLSNARSYRTIAYSASAAIYTYAFSVKGIPELFLIPIFISIPLFNTEMSQTKSMLRIGAYIKVFLENENGLMWENRLVKYDELPKNEDKKKTPSTNSYLMLIRISCIMCIFYALIAFDGIQAIGVDAKLLLLRRVVDVIISLVLFFGSSKYIKNRSIKYKETKDFYIAQWKQIYEEEKTAHSASGSRFSEKSKK